MKPFIEVLPDQVIIETESMTITVHVKAQKAEGRGQRAKSDPGCGLTYTRKAVLEPLPGNGKRRRKFEDRECVVCGNTYEPTGSTQRACCPACKAEMKRKRQLSDMEESELDKTLSEIEERRKRTYEV